MYSFDELEKEIENTKDAFYSESGKNSFFKNNQKFDCARHIVDKISLEVLLNKMCNFFDGAYTLHIDYPTLKLIASPEIFDTISEHIIMKCQTIKAAYNRLELVINLDGFTVSAAERYKSLIQLFCSKCFHLNAGFSSVVTSFILYNSPTLIDGIYPIVKPFISEEVHSKVTIIQKKDSGEFVKKYSSIYT
jgi:hypothetical protein